VKTNDVLVTAFPKSGITFFGFLLCAARLHHNGIKMVPTMYNIDTLLIDLHKMGNLDHSMIWNDGLGNLVKSHEPRTLPWPNVIYVLRNPVDTLRSYCDFQRKLGVHFVLEAEIEAWNKHVSSWLLDNNLASQSICVVQYEDLLRAPAAELETVSMQLGIGFSSATLQHGVTWSDVNVMRNSEQLFAARNPVYSKFDLNFVRKTNARQVNEFTDEMAARVVQQTQAVYDRVRGSLA
jgi:hypothetical protein